MYDALAKKSNFSMKYECLVLGPTLSYLHDAVVAGNSALDSAEDGNETLDSLQGRLRELTNSIQGVYLLLCNRWTMLELRAQLEMDPSTSHRGGAEALRAKLQFVEDRVYQASDGVRADAVLQQWLNDFDKSKGKALLNTTAKQTAGAETGSAPRWKPRDDKKYDKKHDKDKQDDRKPSGAKGKEVMQWITQGCKPRWKAGPPPAFDHGVSLRDASLQQQQWLNEEKHRLLENGEDLACGKGGPGVVVETACDEQVEWPQDLEVTVGTRLEVYWEDDDKFYPGVVKNFNDDGAAHVVYDDGDEETLNLSEEKFNILLCEGENEQNKERGGDYKENKRVGDTQNFFVRSLCGRWKNELGQSEYTDLAILMQRRSLLDSCYSE
ncbi:hypothetical protein CYMTET_37563 [Cymbomonas tetramitiformis]|uniref:Tudor domain-containing protein n=1 Tax=Cymbomonas tetramitiformis TaxID=36881 RepID=A0AAE0CDP2_9CHLO|nr:hypothetical protein CYMTET_37563 [Cymbomonas tetramitiformis]